ncbi:SGNH/GDSL hydrolase family protein [Rhodococcoides yunnanense]|uniref:SGNH/GDSL hydrolase family protein n=1 Tax=Rhodococcoides yunnanense TaxID=278209 RepID=UPI001473348E|nr:SGNH/GDSL hydrolase family protein [Rhodococcus yunnanensis]
MTTLRHLRSNRWVQLGLICLALLLIVVGAGGAYWYLESREPPRDEAIGGIPLQFAGPLQVLRAPDGQPTTVTFIGDSISNGWAATTYEDSYIPKTIATWNSGGPTVAKVDAVSGKKLWEVGKYAAIDPASQLVVIELGTNDVRFGDETEPSEFRRQYGALVRRVKSEAPDAAIVCLGTWRPSSKAREYDGQIAAACDADKSRFLKLTDIYENTNSRGPSGRPVFLSNDGTGDNFHPNDLGYTAIMQRITDSVVFKPHSNAG